jgi:hypothetical protein
MDDNHEHHRNSNEFIGSLPLATAFTTKTLSQDIYDNANAAVRQELVALHVY